MNEVKYAIKIGSEFFGSHWNEKMEWFDEYKDEMCLGNIGEMLFDTYDSAKNEMNELISDLNEHGDVGNIESSDITKIEIVKVKISYELVE